MSDEKHAVALPEQVRNKNMQSLTALNYDAAAELFSSHGKAALGQIKYKRFDNAAEAIRFAVEDLPPAALSGAYLEIDQARFGRHEIHCLYDDAAYPLKRRGNKSAGNARSDTLLPGINLSNGQLSEEVI